MRGNVANNICLSQLSDACLKPGANRSDETLEFAPGQL